MKDLTIIPPKGFEIDTELSNLSRGIIKFKEIPKVITYNDVADKLFRDKSGYYTDFSGEIKKIVGIGSSAYNSNLATTREQLESILALNKLCNVAEYLNEGWKLTPSKPYICIYYDYHKKELRTGEWSNHRYTQSVFKNKDLALKAIEILGEDVVKLALGVRE